MTYRELTGYAHADERQRHEVEAFINGIDDPQTRDMFRLRFLLGLKYFQVALNIGNGMSTDCVKKRIYRYIKKSH